MFSPWCGIHILTLPSTYDLSTSTQRGQKERHSLVVFKIQNTEEKDNILLSKLTDMAAMKAVESTSGQLEPQNFIAISGDEVNLPPSNYEDDAVAAVTKEQAANGTEGNTADDKDPQVNGVLVLALLDKIIGAVDQIQQTQSGLESRQQEMERYVTGIQGELTKLSKSHSTTSSSVNKMMEKVRKVSINVKTVGTTLEKQGGQIKKLENNEAELLKRRNFKVMIYQVREYMHAYT